MMAKDATRRECGKGANGLRTWCQTYRDISTTIGTRLLEVDELLAHPRLNGQRITHKLGEAKAMTQNLFYRLLDLHRKYDEYIRNGEME